MTSISAVQPSFFEGQYLGAEDLAAIVEYFRTHDARRALSHGSWGVVAGLQLVPTEIGGGDFQVSVSPGVAIDGYGRLIVVTQPTEVPLAKFSSLASGSVNVWIRYDQTPIRGARQGFNVCHAEDEFARIEEGFEIEAGDRPVIGNHQSGVTVAGALVADAREAAHSSDPGAPLHCDGGVPYQEFPIDDDDMRWLVPLGTVNWQSASNAFAGQTEDQRVASRVFRRQFGAVAEAIHAANGLIRLRDRATPFQADIGDACKDFGPKARDFIVCDDRVKARELVWLEGDTRVTGDLRLFGTRLEFRDDEGRDYLPRVVAGAAIEAIAPLVMERAANVKNGQDLRVLLGATDDGSNRFTIGPTQVAGTICDVDLPGETHVVVQDNGRVGIGTAGVPDSILSAPLTIRGLEDSITVTDDLGNDTQEPVWRYVNFEDAGGAVQWQVDLWTDAASLALNETGGTAGTLFLREGGNVGIGTTEPEARLEVSNTPVANVGGLGNNLWMRLGDGGDTGDAGRVWVEYGAQRAPLMVLSDHDDPPRVQFQQTGAGGDELAPQRVTWIGHLDGGSDDFGIVSDGRIGLNTQTPFTDVTVEGTLGFKPGNDPLIYMFEAGNGNSDRMVLSHSPALPAFGLSYRDVGDRYVFQRSDNDPVVSVRLDNRRVGILTDTPRVPLEVDGSVRLGDGGDLFALGARPDLRVVAGEVNANGTIARGQQFASVRTGTGRYVVTFNPSFAATPFVVATGFGDVDNLVSIEARSANSVTVRTQDTEEHPGGPEGPTDTAFMFIAMGAR